MTEYEKRSLHFLSSIEATLKELVSETKKLQAQLAAGAKPDKFEPPRTSAPPSLGVRR